MKKRLLILAFVAVLISLLCVSASAVNLNEFNSKSTFTPVDYTTHNSVSEIKLYGNADYMTMKVYSNTNKEDYFCLEIYSDSKRTKLIMNYLNQFKKGTVYEDLFVDLTSLKTKTYYAKAYVVKVKATTGTYETDPDTVRNFKIKVDRKGTALKNMKTIIYGYENSFEGPVLYWYSVPGATKYYVYKLKDGEYKKIATVKANSEVISYYIDSSLKQKNSSATYKVRALNSSGKTDLSVNKVKVYTIAAPTAKTTITEKKGIKLSWSKVSGANKYTVYYKSGSNDWEKLKETTSRSCYLPKYNLKSGTTYSFAVIASGSKAVSGYQPDVKVYYYENATVESVKEKDGSLVVKWNTVKGIDSYNVYRSPDKKNEWTKLANTKETSYTDSTAEENVRYKYKVKSVYKSKEALTAAYTKSGAIFTTPVLTGIEKTAEGYAKISWEKINGVSYTVLRRSEDSKEYWETAGATNETSFVDKNEKLINGKKYYYKVRTYIGDLQGKTSKTEEGFRLYLPIKNFSAFYFDDGIEMSWTAVDGVDGYNIYRKTADSEYTLLGQVSQTKYCDKTAQKNVSYCYKVTYVINGVEISETAFEKNLTVSSEGTKIKSETADVSDSIRIYVQIDGYNEKNSYKLFTRKDSQWKEIEIGFWNDGTAYFNKNENGGLNDYVLISSSSDGVLKGFSQDAVFSLDYMYYFYSVNAEANHEKKEVKLSWDLVGAERYNIYRKFSFDDEYSFVASVDGNTAFYTDTKAQYGENYYVVDAVKGSVIYRSINRDVQLIKAPKVKVKNSLKGVTVSWDKSGDYYTVFRKESGKKTWVEVGFTYSTTYTDETAKNGKTYYYSVEANDCSMDLTGKKITFIKAPGFSKITYYEKSVQLEWKKISSADYYILYRKAEGGSWKKLYTTKDETVLKYKDKTVKSGKKYSYRICSVKNGERSAYRTQSLTFLTTVKGVSAKAVSGGIQISFKKLSGAKFYNIYRKQPGGSYTEIGKVSSSKTSYIDKTAKSGVKYSYVVKAYNLYYSKASEAVTAKR
ncbi:MAG: hypothetical protein IJ262_08660 [Clostridia bacterium]|nr:hypothetical protein [Clostridia bacterium]